VRMGTLLALLRRVEAEESGGLSDAELLARFHDRRDEAAIEALVRRHGPAVFHLCSRVLRHTQDAEDAFQATFLLLVLKARSVRKHTSLGSWLYKVALRVSLHARARAARAARVRSEEDVPAAPPADAVVQDEEVRELLRAEVDRLPERYRLPVVLCYLGGQSTAEAARALGCPRGTVLSRLAAARQRLLRRLVLRGVSLSAAALAPALAQTAAEASSSLVAVTVRAALCVAAGEGKTAGVAGSVVNLMEGVLRSMYWTKMKTAAGVALVLALLAFGLGFWRGQSATAEPRPERKEEVAAAKPAADEKPAEPRRLVIERPLGTYEREVEDGAIRVTLRFEAERLFVQAYIDDGGERFTIIGEADYGITKDAILYGVITSLDVPDDAETAADLSEFMDHTFSLRFRVDGDVLTIKDIKFGLEKGEDLGEEISLLIGRYTKKKDGDRDDAPRRPAPRKRK
jgi:RNA polymerase sigma factor (sigma-70 family)